MKARIEYVLKDHTPARQYHVKPLDAVKAARGLTLAYRRYQPCYMTTGHFDVRDLLLKFIASEILELHLPWYDKVLVGNIASGGTLHAARGMEARRDISLALTYMDCVNNRGQYGVGFRREAMLAVESLLKGALEDRSARKAVRHLHSAIRWAVLAKDSCVHDSVSTTFLHANDRLADLLAQRII